MTPYFPVFDMKLAPIFLGICVALAGCNSTGKNAEERTTTNPKKIGTADGGGLFGQAPKKRRSKALTLPPDLVNSSNETIQENNEQGLAKEAVLPEVIGVEIKSDGERDWLHVETEAEKVWTAMADFWALHKIELVEFTPNTGVMETDWIDSERVEGGGARGILADLFNRVVGKGTTFDKFRVRLERAGEASTNVYVSHNATSKVESNNNAPIKAVEYEWVARESDPEKVALLLQQLVILFDSGLPEST